MEKNHGFLSDVHDTVQDTVQDTMETVQGHVRQGKKKVVHLLFGRTIIIFLLILLQLSFLVLIGLYLTRYVYYVFGFYIFVGFLLANCVINRVGTPETKLPWIVMILAFPVLGGFFYLYVEFQPITRRLNQKIIRQTERTRSFLHPDPRVAEEIREKDGILYGMTGYLDRCGFPAFRNHTTKYFSLGDYWYEDLLQEIKGAKRFIFLEYFIIEHGSLWDELLCILKDKVKEGVEVRIMYDGTLQFASLSHKYQNMLKAAGIKCQVFSPIVPMLSTYQNNRDHRKIMIIDGRIAYTGGTNLADEYVNRLDRFGHWKDAAVKITGEAVKSMTMQFFQLWDIDGFETDYEDYLLSLPDPLAEEEGGYVIPYCDSPLDAEPIGKFVYMSILQKATKYVYIMTPYLILDHEVITAMTYAARRGVEVALILPGIPDKEYAYALAQTHYKELLANQVKIYEYDPGFVHSKVFVSDDEIAVVGTINLDYRSLNLHFENAVLLYEVPEILRIREDFENTREQCTLQTQETLAAKPAGRKAKGWILKMFAPLM